MGRLASIDSNASLNAMPAPVPVLVTVIPCNICEGGKKMARLQHLLDLKAGGPACLTSLGTRHHGTPISGGGWAAGRRFHVDDLSSAHVYLRLPEGVDIDHIPEATLEDCCQLVKANSIQAGPAPLRP